MNEFKNKLSQKTILAILMLIVGIALGVFYAWQVNPVKWEDGTTSQMRLDLRVDYLRMMIDSYAVNEDVNLALERYESLGEDKADILAEVGEKPGTVSDSDIQRFKEMVETFPGVQSPEETATADAQSEEASSISKLLLPVCGATLLLGLLLGAALILRRRMDSGVEDVPYEDDFIPMNEHLAESTLQVDQPLATFRTSFTMGDDLYDDSFSIESASGDFLGECGVGIGDVIGVGDPKKVSAFEIWLFDKNDIQTVTKVLMSRYSFSDSDARAKLAAKGDPVEARSGEVITLQTASLQVEARIVDMNYGDSALPPESFFDRLTIELRAFSSAY